MHKPRALWRIIWCRGVHGGKPTTNPRWNYCTSQGNDCTHETFVQASSEQIVAGCCRCPRETVILRCCCGSRLWRRSRTFQFHAAGQRQNSTNKTEAFAHSSCWVKSAECTGTKSTPLICVTAHSIAKYSSATKGIRNCIAPQNSTEARSPNHEAAFFRTSNRQDNLHCWIPQACSVECTVCFEDLHTGHPCGFESFINAALYLM